MNEIERHFETVGRMASRVVEKQRKAEKEADEGAGPE